MSTELSWGIYMVSRMFRGPRELIRRSRQIQWLFPRRGFRERHAAHAVLTELCWNQNSTNSKHKDPTRGAPGFTTRSDRTLLGAFRASLRTERSDRYERNKAHRRRTCLSHVGIQFGYGIRTRDRRTGFQGTKERRTAAPVLDTLPFRIMGASCAIHHLLVEDGIIL